MRNIGNLAANIVFHVLICDNSRMKVIHTLKLNCFEVYRKSVKGGGTFYGCVSMASRESIHAASDII